MKQLTCEMCGSTDLIKQDGVFVCQTCGTKYSVEDAKKMMIEGTVEVAGTVAVDNSAFHGNYFQLAVTAYENSNNIECEKYCNKILETDPNNYQAYLYKGKAAGWQSTVGNNRINEAVSSFKTALRLAPEEEKEIVVNDCVDEIYAITNGLLSLQLDNFSKWTDREEAQGIFKTLTECVSAMADYNDLAEPYFGKHLLIMLNPILLNVSESIDVTAASVINAYVEEAQKGIRYNDTSLIPNKFDAENLYQKLIICSDLLENCAESLEKTLNFDVSLYEELGNKTIGVYKKNIALLTELNELVYGEYNTYTGKHDVKKMPGEYIATNNRKIDESKKRINLLKKEIANQKKVAYENKSDDEKKDYDYSQAVKSYKKGEVDKIKTAIKRMKKISPWKDSEEIIAKWKKEINDIQGQEYVDDICVYNEYCNTIESGISHGKYEELPNIDDNILFESNRSKYTYAIDSLKKLESQDSQNALEQWNKNKAVVESIRSEYAKKVDKYTYFVIGAAVLLGIVGAVLTWWLKTSAVRAEDSGYGILSDYLAPPQYFAYGGIPTLILGIIIAVPCFKSIHLMIYNKSMKNLKEQFPADNVITGWVSAGNNKYFFDENGELAKYRQWIDGKLYYFNGSGKMHKGWLDIKNDRYYFGEDGVAITGSATIDGETFTFNDKGVLLS